LLIDLGGVAKGYAVDQAVANCAPELRLLVNAGGDLRATHWQSETIQLRLPEDPLKLISVPLKGSAMATSAGYFQTHASALVDPVSRTPVKMSQSVSVFAPTCMLADALTKVALLHPNPGPLLHSMRAEAIVVDEFGDIHDL
jgi:thiamine biosynthesis lipoprotein